MHLMHHRQPNLVLRSAAILNQIAYVFSAHRMGDSAVVVTVPVRAGMGRKAEESLRLIWIETFLAVHDHGSFSKAAKHLNLSQPTVSRHVQAIHLWLRSPPFSSAVPVTLSAEGEAFVPIARQVCELLQRSRGPLPDPLNAKSGSEITIKPATK